MGRPRRSASRFACADTESEQLIAGGVATGGMQAKLNAAISALRQGVAEVRIAPGAADRILERVLAGDPAGTRLTPGLSQ